MNYIGSKKSLLSFIENSVKQVIEEKNFTLIDLFAGTGAVGQHFKKLGNKIIANDLQLYSYVLNKNYIENHKPLNFSNLLPTLPPNNEPILFITPEQVVCNYLNNLQGKEGFIFNNYCLGGKTNEIFGRQYFSDYNGKKADAIRLKIEDWKNTGFITENEYYFLLASLIESLDKVANTASVYGAYLKKLKKTAKVGLDFQPATFFCGDEEHQVFNQNAEDLITIVKGDVLYLDPPYNQRQYATNYHLLETIAKYDNPKIYGKTGLRDYSNQKSNFCYKEKASQSLLHIVKNANVKYIFLSYNNEGIIPLSEIKRILSSRGNYGCFTKDYVRYKADSNREYTKDSVLEYIHYVECKIE